MVMTKLPFLSCSVKIFEMYIDSGSIYFSLIHIHFRFSKRYDNDAIISQFDIALVCYMLPCKV